MMITKTDNSIYSGANEQKDDVICFHNCYGKHIDEAINFRANEYL